MKLKVKQGRSRAKKHKMVPMEQMPLPAAFNDNASSIKANNIKVAIYGDRVLQLKKMANGPTSPTSPAK